MNENCVTLPAKRLYAGARWEIQLPYDTPVTFKSAWGKESDVESF